MKTSIRTIAASALFATALSFSPLAFAQEAAVTTTTSTSSDGTVTEFSPDSVVIHSETSSAPVTYSYSKETTVVDQDGNPVDVSVIKSGVPIQVYYAQDAGRMVARKIIVHRAVAAEVPATGVIVKKTTTATTTGPQ